MNFLNKVGLVLALTSIFSLLLVVADKVLDQPLAVNIAVTIFYIIGMSFFVVTEDKT